MSTAQPIRLTSEPPTNVVQLHRRSGPKHPLTGRTWPPSTFPVEEINQLLQHCTPRSPGRYGYLSSRRLRALIVVLYRSAVRISEALAFEERDIDPGRHTLLVRHGKGNKHRPVLLDPWGWDELQSWLPLRQEIPGTALFPVLRGPTAGQPMSPTDVRRQMRELQAIAGIRRRFRPHQLRHTWTVEANHEQLNWVAIQRQLGHVDLRVTEAYLRSIDPMTALEPIGHRPPPRIVIPPPTH